MTQSLQDLLDQVRNVEAEPAEWARLQTRVAEAMVDAQTVVTATAGVARPSPSVQSAAVVRPGGWATWLGGGVAAGALIAAAFVGARSLPGLPAEGELPSAPSGSMAWQPVVLDAPFEQTRAEIWSTPKRHRNKARTSPRRSEATVPPAVERDVVPTPPAVPSPPEVRPLGESDVEYDRRHLAPIDAALQARQPRRALELLAAFRPRKLANYASALEAIARCNAGELEAGKRLGEQTLPRLTNRGIARRVATACGLASATE